MGDSLSSKLQSHCHSPIAFCRIRLLRVPEGATADGEEQGFDGAGEKMERSEQWPRTSKTAWLFSKLHLLARLHNRLS